MLGACFNNAVDYEASKAICGSFQVFEEGLQGGSWEEGGVIDKLLGKARFVMVPTETCKMGPFTLRPEDLAPMAHSPNRAGLKEVIMADVGQWTDLKRGDAQVTSRPRELLKATK